VLRVLEDALIKSAAHDMTVRARAPVALYILNQKRAHLRDLERRFGVAITVEADDALTGSNYHAIERGEPSSGTKAEDAGREPEIRPAGYGAAPADAEDFAIEEDVEAAEEPEAGEGEAAEDELEAAEVAREGGEAAEGEGEQGRRRRRRRRRRGAERAPGEGVGADAPQPTDAGLAAVAEIGGDFAAASPPRGEGETVEEEEGRAPGARRRRSRRGRRGERDRFAPPSAESGALEAAEPGEPGSFGEELAPLLAAEPEAEPLFAVEPEAPTPATSREPEQPSAWESAAPSIAAEPALQPAEAAPEAAPAEAAPTAAEDASRPRRSGWWQRARATLVGE